MMESCFIEDIVYFLGTQELIIIHQSKFAMKLETQKYLINEISN